MKKITVLTCAAGMLAGASALAGGPNAAYAASSIDARLNVAVKENTEVVHFVRDDATPNVITKAYVIKHVDPYELRSYIRGIVQTRCVNTKLTNVEAVKYTDGSALLLISAEDYRFNDTPTAQGFDSIVKELDKPKLVASSGRKTYVYSPKYRSSAEIAAMVRSVGAFGFDEVMGNLGGTDVLINDPGLNLIFFNTAPFSRKTIMDVLNEYDKPYPEVRAKVTVYELYAENDTQLGLDFQAWKNNEGIDLFSAGGRFSRNSTANALARGGKWNDTTYFQFNPKWNTKYIDFLTSKGKAKVVQSAEISLRNNTTGMLTRRTQVFLAKSTPIADQAISKYCTAASGAVPMEVARDSAKRPIFISANSAFTVMAAGSDLSLRYTLRTDNGNFISSTGANLGKKVECDYVVTELADKLVAFNSKESGNTITTEASDEFGLTIAMTPSVNTKATMLNVMVENSSLIGYTSDGSPRIQKGAKIDTDFMISNEGTKLVIGGIEKRSVMRVSGGLPILKDLPLIGWLFSTETEATKRSQLVVVAEVVPAAKADNSKQAVADIKKELDKAGKSNTFGYRQYLIDADRK